MRPGLSSQEKKKFKEERARRILMYLFPDRYANTILSESPDIVSSDKDIGVEVTDALASRAQERLSRASNITGKTGSELAEINRRNIQMRCVTAMQAINRKHMAGFVLWGNLYDIEEAYKKKLVKLNSSHFTRCNTNNLLIIAAFIGDSELSLGIEKILAVDKSLYDILFDYVYIFTEKNNMIEINVATNNISKYFIPPEELTKISDSTFITIMGMRKDE